jgi:hypothetical protein|tara:strand:- start:202 stop:1482 length:1281 start_codon:yes stop_codon:yes gene_type:complete
VFEVQPANPEAVLVPTPVPDQPLQATNKTPTIPATSTIPVETIPVVFVDEEFEAEFFDDYDYQGLDENGCLPEETYDEVDDYCYFDCIDEECDYDEYYADYEDFDMLPEDCYDFEQYDPIEKVCYVDCDTDEECAAYDERIDALAEDIGDDYFEDGEDYPGMFDEEDREEAEITILAVYTINGEKITLQDKPSVSADFQALQNDDAKHQAIWAKYIQTIPRETTPMLSTFQVVTDGEDETLAAVGIIEGTNKFELLIDIKDAYLTGSLDNKDLTYTMIHESARLYTLNDKQLVANEQLVEADFLLQQQVCNPRYGTDEGCATEKSYLNLYFKAFWKDIYPEWVKLQEVESDDEYYSLSEAFGRKYDDRFLTEYASSSVEEDIAESFTGFVLKDKPTTSTVQDQKILFWYRYPEMEKLRKVIRSRMG